MRRLRQLQTGQDEQLFLRAAWDGEQAEERALHARFAASRKRGEWFDLSADLVAFVESRREDYEQRLAELRAADPAAEVRAAEVRAAKDRAADARAAELRARARRIALSRPPEFRSQPDYASADLPVRTKSCSPDEWFTIFCDRAPSTEVDVLLAYVELIADADPGGRVHVDLDRLATRVFGDVDRPAIASLVYGLREVQLAAHHSPYSSGRRSWLVESLLVYHRADMSPQTGPGLPEAGLRSLGRTDADFIDAMVAHGAAELVFMPLGAGFGPASVPSTYPRGGQLDERANWARHLLMEARARTRVLSAA
ncbi:MAG: hypothetical protein M3N47_14190 [Chloroflexota bacterium]|nr:hypothetical protein [Chloroflexota bacterium]